MKQTETSSLTTVGIIKCFSFGQIGHKKPMCPNLNKNLTNVCYVPLMIIPEPGITPTPSDVKIPVELNGKKVIALVDTGCTQTLVENDLVSECSVETDCLVMVKCIHGEKWSYPVTEMYLGVNEQSYLMKVG